jgi:serine/threonine-protein kinase
MVSAEATPSPVPAVFVCPCCGARYQGTARFCVKDGTPLRELRPEHAADALAGRDVGRYRIVRRLGTGGMSRVYLAVENGTGRRCAIKTLDPEIASSADGLQRFRREATNHARVGAHPHVCALLDFGTTPDGIVYIALEYVEAESLAARLRRTGTLPPRQVAEIVRQAASGLAAAHAHGLVHRDLKPDHVLLGQAPDGSDHVTLIDFGIAKSAHDRHQRVTSTGVAVGTPLFMSPEQLAADAVDARSDIYSLALVTFLMLAGRLPFPSDMADAMTRRMLGELQTLGEVRPEVRWPAALQAALARALAPVPDERYAMVEHFARDLRLAIAGWESVAVVSVFVERAILRGTPPAPPATEGVAPPSTAPAPSEPPRT